MIINAEVKLQKNIDSKVALDRALKRLKAKLDNEGTLDTVRLKRNFLNKTQRRAIKQKIAAKKAKMQKGRN